MVVAAVLAIGLFARGPHHPAAVPGHRAAQRGDRALHLPAGARVPDALHRVAAGPLGVPAAKSAGSSASPTRAPALIVCNHVSFVDALVIAAACRRPIRFVMDHRIFRIAGAQLRVPHRQGDPDRRGEGGPGDAGARLRRGREGAARGRRWWPSSPRAASPTPARLPVPAGLKRILEATPVPVVPMALRGLWGSFLLPQGWRRDVASPGACVAVREDRARGRRIRCRPAQATPEALQAQVAELRGEWR